MKKYIFLIHYCGVIPYNCLMASPTNQFKCIAFAIWCFPKKTAIIEP